MLPMTPVALASEAIVGAAGVAEPGVVVVGPEEVVGGDWLVVVVLVVGGADVVGAGVVGVPLGVPPSRAPAPFTTPCTWRALSTADLYEPGDPPPPPEELGFNATV